MAIKGLSYTKTSWAFEERPVSSVKLNQWDDRIETALEIAFVLLNQAWGGGSGVLRAMGGELAVSATDPADLRVSVASGYAFLDAFPLRLKTAVESAVVTPPVTHNRVDLVQVYLTTWNVSVKQGVESATPIAPATDADAIALAELVLRPGMTAIKDADDGVNGYIVDRRVFV